MIFTSFICLRMMTFKLLLSSYLWFISLGIIYFAGLEHLWFELIVFRLFVRILWNITQLAYPTLFTPCAQPFPAIAPSMNTFTFYFVMNLQLFLHLIIRVNFSLMCLASYLIFYPFIVWLPQSNVFMSKSLLEILVHYETIAKIWFKILVELK